MVTPGEIVPTESRVVGGDGGVKGVVVGTGTTVAVVVAGKVVRVV